MSDLINDRAASDGDLRRVTRFWIRNGLKQSSVAIYCRWIRIFREYCQARKLEPLQEVTVLGVRRFAKWYASKHRAHYPSILEGARSAVHAWACALASLGVSLPAWARPTPQPAVRVPVVREFLEYRQKESGVAVQTLKLDRAIGMELYDFVRRRKRTCGGIRLLDVDAFTEHLRQRMSVVSLAGCLSSVRAFLRFLHVSGRLKSDLAASVVAPFVKRDAAPPKALAWSAVRRILNAVDRTTPIGCRDYAILLLMSLYGLGGAEIIAVRLEDIDWNRKTICFVRPKTKATILLPLLPEAGRALADYLRRGRPTLCPHRQVFLRWIMPRAPFTQASPIAYLLTKYAQRAGVTSGPLGSHVLRHSQATRQVELGTSLKIVGDILGHRHPLTTSHYVRSAVHRLRDLALPLPYD